MTKAILLDRDGTLLVEMGYLAHPSLVTPYKFTAEALRRARASGFLLVMITNQSGVARGWLSEDDVAAIHERMQQLLGGQGAELDAIYYCPHHPEGTVGSYRKTCGCRKPGIELGKAAVDKFGIDVSKSLLIGDKLSDLRFGLALGVKPCLVRTGFGACEEHKLEDGLLATIHVADNVLEAVAWATREEDGKP